MVGAPILIVPLVLVVVKMIVTPLPVLVLQVVHSNTPPASRTKSPSVIQMTPFDTVAVAAATVVGEPPPVNVMVGADVYPEPGFVTVMDATFWLLPPPLMVAVAVAPDPPPPVKLTVGAELYLLPWFVTVTDPIPPEGTRSTVAFLIVKSPQNRTPPATEGVPDTQYVCPVVGMLHVRKLWLR